MDPSMYAQTTGRASSEEEDDNTGEVLMRCFANKKSSVPFIFNRREIILQADGTISYKNLKPGVNSKIKTKIRKNQIQTI
mmetsp:Transcript_14327/g.24384  ORF Transcript_14327/g.24384 Transcript_14327/m.24384 type:complete len:80 (+) Transcript_14327:1481-1720(+)